MSSPGQPDTETPRPMTIEEFLRWHDEDARRWELVDGQVRELAVPSSAHSEILATLAALVGGQIGPPYRIGTEAALIMPDRDDILYLADLVMTRLPRTVEERLFPDPCLIAEVLVPATEAYDRHTKLPDYMALPSVREILFLSSTEAVAEVWRFDGDDWAHELIASIQGIVTLRSVAVTFPLAEIYRHLRL